MDMALQFRNLLMVIEKGSLGKAAEALRISQPAMTKSIRRLEEQLGVPLFDRGARGMRPTLYGNVLRAHAQGITIGIEQALRDIAALRAGSEGTVRVAAGPIMTNEILVKAVLRLMRDRPKLRINIHTAIGNMGLVREENATLSEVPLNSPLMIRSIGVMWRKNAFLSQPCLLLIKALREVCSEMKAASLE
jgi:DNA-binding transcriptional LysR family regulator